MAFFPFPILLPLAAAFAAPPTPPAPEPFSAVARGNAITRYDDPRHNTLLPFGKASFWLQPRRAYQECPPGDRLVSAFGMNLNLSEADVASGAVALLASHGVRHGRTEVGWGAFSYEDETKIAGGDSRLRALLRACKAAGVRPLLLLNSHHGVPGPHRLERVKLARPAKAGDRSVFLPREAVKGLVPRKSGLAHLTGYMAPEAIFTRIDAATGECRLGKPLPKNIGAADTVEVARLRYAPFGTPGSPEYRETLGGWLRYAEAVCALAESEIGPGGFDIEVWNELMFGSHFLYLEEYDDAYPKSEAGPKTNAILAATVERLGAKYPGVGVSDGFANQWPWAGGGAAPPGLAGIGKHPYFGPTRLPQKEVRSRMVDALGNDEPDKPWQPTLTTRFPEQLFTGQNTENLVRDLGPFEYDLYGALHGRNTRPRRKDGTPAPAPQMWVTETNVDLGDVGPKLPPADLLLVRRKAALRTLASFTAAGPCRVYFYAARGNDGWGFLDGGEDGRPLSAPVLEPVSRLVGLVKGKPAGKPRPLRVARVETSDPGVQFGGDPADPLRHPPLRNLDCAEVRPFQRGDRSWAVVCYVASRDVAKRYEGGAYLMREQPYRVRLEGAFDGAAVTPRLSDPLTGAAPRPAAVRARGAGFIEVEIPLTDCPRVLTLTER